MSGSDDETAVLVVNPDELVINSCEQADVESSDEEGSKALTVEEALATAGFGKFHFLLVFVMGWANSSDAVEMLSISFVLPYASCELNATDLELGLLTAVGFGGMTFGSYFWGGIADIKGRIKTLMICQAINSLFIIGSGLSQSLWFLILMRLISGFGVGGTIPLIFVYTVETLPAKNRGRMTGLLSCTFMVGQVLVAGMAWLIIPMDWSWNPSPGFTLNGWRIFLFVSAIPAFTSLLLFIIFPESPRYLIGRNRMTEAKKAIRYIYRWNGNKEIYDDSYTIKRPAEVAKSKGCCGTLKQIAKNSWNLVALEKVRPRFLYSSSIMFCLSFSYYGLTMWFPTLITRMQASNASSVCDDILPAVNKTNCVIGDQNVVYTDTFLQAVSSFPGNLLYLALVDVIGRRVLTGVSMILTAVAVFFIWLIQSYTGSIIMSCVFSAITAISRNAMALLSTEIFPTDLRSTARGVQSAMFSRVAAILATIIFGVLVSTHCEVPIILISCLLALGGILTYKLPETTNIPVD
ncbi:synaptic vesicle glycoprotein 2C-like [Watersipora subatra]|uniref:synaptic vesicle glycoprotein 2C-like n=1 Tax=Watersipora subatra TaxID=2589382 RepID=UPI00355C0E45